MAQTDVIEAEESMATRQARQLREAREILGMTSQQLADELGVTLVTLNSWLRPPTTKGGTPAKAYRTMPDTARKLLERVMADGRKKKKD